MILTISSFAITEFAPNADITREQMAAILCRYAQHKGMETEAADENLEQFTDNGKISEYAVSALNWAVGCNIINGKAVGILNPLGSTTRAEAATMLTGLLEIIN